MTPATPFTVIETHVNPWDAHISRALLASGAIHAFLENEHHVTANWSMSRMLGGVRVMVPTAQLSAARTLLSLRDQGVFEAALNEQFPPDTVCCLKCGCTQFVEKRPIWTVLLAVVFLLKLNIIFPPGKRSLCMTCNHPVRRG